MTRKKIAILGANEPLIPFFEQTKILGYEIHCFAWPEGAVCKKMADFFYPISFSEKTEILNLCREIRVDGITSFSLESALPTVNYIAQELNLIGNPPVCEEFTIDKFTMREQLKRCSVSIPAYEIIKSESELNDLDIEFPVIVKPVDSGGSRGVTKVDKYDDLVFAYKRALKYSKKGQVLVEQFIDGREFSVEYISFEGKHYFVTITDKVTTGPPYFVELEHHQPANIPASLVSAVKRITEQTLDALAIYSSPSHTEIKIDDSGHPYIIEVGARMGGDMITSDLVRLSTGYDFVKGTLELSTGDFTSPVFSENKYSGIFYLSKETERIMPLMINPEKYPQIVKTVFSNREIKEVKESNDRSGYLIYQSDKKFTLTSLNP